mmetsp:Transcript_108659/g.286593  ORF Transcript_108659/g.286593 Transcript_108659/m.286593 type:complete len:319 (-) Transcript_108659:741-1697(-)
MACGPGMMSCSQCKFLQDTLAAAEDVIISELDIELNQQGEEQFPHLENEERRARKDEEQQVHMARRRRAEAEALWRAEEEARNHAENLRRRVKDAERAFKDEKARFEQLRSDRERAEQAEGAIRTEAKRLASERERKAAVLAFLQEHGFSSVDKAKRKMLRKNYPIHVAAEKGDDRMVQMLLKEGADASQRNSAGRTAMQIAVDKDRDNSHQAVVRTLQRALSNVSFDASIAPSEASTPGPCRRARASQASTPGSECGADALSQSCDSVQRKVSFDERSDGSLSERSQVSRHSRRSGHSADKHRVPGRSRRSGGLGGA